MKMIKELFNTVIQTLKLIRIPRGMELLLILVFVGAYALLNAFVICGDCFFGYAITEKIMHPEWFHTSDLVVSTGAKNFLFYRLLANIPWFLDNFNLRDFVLSAPLTLLLVLGWYNIFFELTKNKKITLLAIFFLLFSDTKLFLHGYPIPFFVLTSIGSVHFVQVFAFYFFLKKKYLLSTVLLGLTFYLHPASGLVYLSIILCCLAIEAYKTKKYRLILKPMFVACLIIIPYVILLGENLYLHAEEKNRFFELTFALKQFTTLFISEYFHRSYVYTFAALALTMFLMHTNRFMIDHKEKIRSFIIIGFVGSGLWLINLYFIQNLNVFYTLFIARAFYILKPLLLLHIVWTFNDFFTRKNIVLKLFALVLVASFMTFSSLVGGIVLLCAIAVYFAESKFPWLKVKDEYKEKKNLILLIGCIVLAGILFGYLRNNKFYKLYQLVQGKNTFNFSFDFDTNYSISKMDPEFSALLDWAKQYKGKMFVVPIEGRNNFVYFRYMTKNGIYANIDDLGQLTYSPHDFLEGYNRMVELGFKITESGILDFSGYGSIAMEKLKTTGADFAIFDKKSPGYSTRLEIPVFETERFVVYQLK